MVLCFTADEEAGGHQGAEQIVREASGPPRGLHARAIGEVGGFSATVRGKRVYLIEAAEKGMAWMRLTAKGNAGHGSMRHPDNAVTALSAAVARIGAHQWPVRLTPSMQVLLSSIGELAGVEATPENAEDLVEEFGSAARMLGAVIKHTTNPTMLSAGYKVNVVPGEATAHVDGRFLPGYEDEFFATLAELVGDRITIDYVSKQSGLETTFDGDLVDAMTASLLAEDPDALVAPYLMSGGTDAKHWNKLGIRCFGFAPLRLPADLDFTALFHGVDERVPTDALEFGARVFDRFLDGPDRPAQPSPARRPARRRAVSSLSTGTTTTGQCGVADHLAGGRAELSARGTRLCRGSPTTSSSRPRGLDQPRPAEPCRTSQVDLGVVREVQRVDVGTQLVQHGALEVGQRRHEPRGPRRGAGRGGQRPGACHDERDSPAGRPGPRPSAGLGGRGEPSYPTRMASGASVAVASVAMGAPRGGGSDVVGRALPDDLAAQHDPAGAVGGEPEPVELPAAVLGPVDEHPGHGAAGELPRDRQPLELVLHTRAAAHVAATW